jgi:YD repeat-containing protein
MALLRRYRVVDAFNSGIDKLAVQIDPVEDYYAEAVLLVGVDGTPVTDAYTQAFEYDANGNLIYQGRATPGTAKGAPYWQLKRYTYDANGNLTDVQYAGGSTAFASAWTDRAALTYA